MPAHAGGGRVSCISLVHVGQVEVFGAARVDLVEASGSRIRILRLQVRRKEGV